MQERLDLANWYDEFHLSGSVIENFRITYPDRPVPSKHEVLLCHKKLHEYGTVSDMPRSGGPKKYTTMDEKKILNAFCSSPTKSLRQAVQEDLGSYFKVRAVLKNAHLYPYKMQIMHELLSDDYEKRVKFSQDMLRLLKSQPSVIERILFGDEAIFYVNGHINHQNVRYWANSNPHIVFEKPLHSPKVMVWMGLMKIGLVGPFFFEGSVTGLRYLEMLKGELMPSLIGMCGGQTDGMFFMQDGAPPHFANPVKAFLREEFPGRVIGRDLDIPWPPRSPDLTPCDFFLWGFLKQGVFARKPRDLTDLKNKIIEAKKDVTTEMIEYVLAEFKYRLEQCIQNGGDHIE